jgi:hypothetical protein
MARPGPGDGRKLLFCVAARSQADRSTKDGTTNMGSTQGRTVRERMRDRTREYDRTSENGRQNEREQIALVCCVQLLSGKATMRNSSNAHHTF